MRLVSAGDSLPVSVDRFKVYLLRVSTLMPRGTGSYALGWKQAPRGSVDGNRPEESTPVFAEMANPGTTFEGDWDENQFFCQPEIRRLVRWPESFDRSRLFEAANEHAARMLTLHKQYAGWTGLELWRKNIEDLEARLGAIRQSGGCLLSIGWGAGLLGKSAWLDTNNADYRQQLQHLSIYGKALSSNLPFPKTRHILFLDNKPATQPGWAMLEVF
jgi:CRISPR-associated protein Csm5